MVTDVSTSDVREESELYFKRNPWLAAVLNIFVPGLGLFYCGEVRFGITLAALYPVIKTLTFFTSIYLQQQYRSVAVYSFYVYSFLLLLIFAIIIARKNKKYTLQSYNSLSIYAIFTALYFFYSTLVYDVNFDLHRVKDEYMINTLLPEDETVVQMSKYGFTLPYFDKKIINWSSPKINEVVLFLPEEFGKKGNKYFCNRVVGVAGDTVMLRNKKLYVNGILEPHSIKNKFDDVIRDTAWTGSVIYPANIKWDFDYYGPVRIPKKDEVIAIDTSNISLWKSLIYFENPPDKLDPDVSDAEQKYMEGLARTVLKTGSYKIRNNYFFLLPDNRTELIGNKITGLIAEDFINGKVQYILSNFDSKKDNDKRDGKKIE